MDDVDWTKAEEIKKQGLIENTCQGIFNELLTNEQKRDEYSKRWAWELLQNALDSAEKKQRIKIRITKKGAELTFEHDGHPFSQNEIFHLIYHGSSKVDKNDKGEYGGRFGVGFLVSHLLCKKVRVRGIGQIGGENGCGKFDFILDRDGKTVDELVKSAENAWDQWKKSFTSTERLPDYTAEYTYDISEDTSGKIADDGIKQLAELAPYVLAFNDRFGSIELSTDEDQTRKFESIPGEVKNGLHIIKTVKEERAGKPQMLHEFLIVEEDGLQIALKLKKQSDSDHYFEDLQYIPKIFVRFPLFGTTELSFPVIVNSTNFEPTEDRGGIHLEKADTDEIKKNKKLLETARDLFIGLVSGLDREKREKIYTLLALDQPHKKEWLDVDWYTGNLLRPLIEQIQTLEVFMNVAGKLIAPAECIVPFTDSSDYDKQLWATCSKFAEYRDRLPNERFVDAWVSVFKSWKGVGLNVESRLITVDNLAEHIEKQHSLANFKTTLSGEGELFVVLNNFYKLLFDMEKNNLFDERRILPNQDGIFRNRIDLYKDDAINSSLKDIANGLGVNVSSVLLHLSIYSEKVILKPKTEEEVLAEILGKKKLLEDVRYNEINAELFKWLLNHDRFDSLQGYMVFSVDDEKPRMLQKTEDELLLAPSALWDTEAQAYADLFPKSFTLSSIYAEKVPRTDDWKKLEREGFIWLNPIHQSKLSKEEFRALIQTENKLDDTVDHAPSADVMGSRIAFLDLKDAGIIDTIRGSKLKAKTFLRFVFSYAIEKDERWTQHGHIEVDCTCGSKHTICPVGYVATLKKRFWVPAPKDKEISTESLAYVLKGDANLVAVVQKDKPLQFLRLLGISNISGLLLATMDEGNKIEADAAISSLLTKVPTQLAKLAQLAETGPLFIEKLEEGIKNAEQVSRNNQIGSTVENRLREVLERSGFSVERTGVGSDFLIESDFSDSNEEVLLEIKKGEKTSFYIEVKSTARDYVRMTLKQAQTAVDNPEKYILCVVELHAESIDEEKIRKVARFVTDIGPKLNIIVSNVGHLQTDGASKTEDVEVDLADAVHLKVKAHAWKEAKTFDQFLEFCGKARTST